jgi:hypothetical protein
VEHLLFRCTKWAFIVHISFKHPTPALCGKECDMRKEIEKPMIVKHKKEATEIRFFERITRKANAPTPPLFRK